MATTAHRRKATGASFTSYGDLPMTNTISSSKRGGSNSRYSSAPKSGPKKMVSFGSSNSNSNKNGQSMQQKKVHAPRKMLRFDWSLLRYLILGNIVVVLGFLLYQKYKIREISQMEPIYHFLGAAPKTLNGDYVVIVSAATGRPFQTHVRVGRSNSTAQEALRRASNRLPLHHSYPYIKIDYVTGIKRIENFDYFQPFPPEMGEWFGLAFNWTDGTVFLPDQVKAHSLVDSARYLRWERILQWMHDRNPKKISEILPDISDDMTEMPHIDLFHTHSIFVDLSGGGYPVSVPLFRGHRRYNVMDVTPHKLRLAAIGIGKFLMQHDAEGILTSYYQPRSDFVEDTSHYEMWQSHASAIFAMANLYHVWKDHALMQSLDHAIGFLVNNIQICQIPFTASATRCIVMQEQFVNVTRKSARLGVNSMFLLALVEFIDATAGDQDHLSLALDVARFVAGCQRDSEVNKNKPAGSFVQRIFFDPNGLDDEYTDIHAESLAAFALGRTVNVMRKYRHPFDGAWQEKAFMGVKHLVHEASQFESDYSINPYLLHAIAELTEFQDKHLGPFLEYSVNATKAINKYQIRNSEKRPDFVGSIVDDPSATTSAALSEGLCAIYKTFLKHDKKKEAHEILDIALHSVAYQLQSQFHPEVAMFMFRPERVMGGMHQSPDHLDMAIDDSLHNVVSFLCVAATMDHNKKAHVTW